MALRANNVRLAPELFVLLAVVQVVGSVGTLVCERRAKGNYKATANKYGIGVGSALDGEGAPVNRIARATHGIYAASTYVDTQFFVLVCFSEIANHAKINVRWCNSFIHGAVIFCFF